MQQPWLNSYPPDVPAVIDPDAYPSLVALIAEICTRFSTKRAFGSFGTYLTYAALDRQAEAFAAYLQQRLHVHPGDRVALMLPNLLQYPVALLGVLRCGAVVVNTNPLYTARELKHQLNDAEVKVIVIYEPMLGVLAEVLATTSLKAIVTTAAGDMFPNPKRLLVNLKMRGRGERLRLSRTIAWPQVLARGAQLRLSAPPIAGHDLAFLQYTGGTTGVAKGAMLSHRNLIANILQAFVWTRGLVRPGEEVIVTALPLYHIFALTMNCFTFMLHGGLNCLIANPRDLKQMIDEFKRLPFTAITGVNTLFNALAQHADFRKLDFSNLRFVGGGGSAIQQAVAERWRAVTGTTIVEGFGLTEASPLVCINPPSPQEFSGDIGLPAPSTECRIVAEDGTDQPPETAGELWVRGPQVMQGYWRRPADTAAVLTADGWLKTGDIAVMRADGFFKIVDRLKDMILVSGFNVYPNEIEEVVALLAGVHEVAAIGVPSNKTGEAVKVIIVPSDPRLTAEVVLAHCRRHLTQYKIPRQVVLVDDLPKSAIGKILRREVRERHGREASV